MRKTDPSVLKGWRVLALSTVSWRRRMGGLASNLRNQVRGGLNRALSAELEGNGGLSTIDTTSNRMLMPPDDEWGGDGCVSKIERRALGAADVMDLR